MGEVVSRVAPKALEGLRGRGGEPGFERNCTSGSRFGRGIRMSRLAAEEAGRIWTRVFDPC